MKPSGSPCSPKKPGCHHTNLKMFRSVPVRASEASVQSLAATVSPVITPRLVPVVGANPEQSVEQKRLLIRKQLVILLHSVVCRRRDLLNTTRGDVSPQPCNVPFCGLMKTVLVHLNSCKAGRTCPHTHCASSRQILIHWKYCVKTECPVCVSLRQVVPTSLLQIFPNPLCRAEIMQRIARQQQQNATQGEDQAVPELMESEE